MAGVGEGEVGACDDNGWRGAAAEAGGQAGSPQLAAQLTARRMTICMRRLLKRSRLWAIGCTL